MFAKEVDFHRIEQEREGLAEQTAMADLEKEDLYRLRNAIEEKSEGEIQRIKQKYE